VNGGLATSAIAPYLAGTTGALEPIFRCPSDEIQGHTAGTYLYSYSMNGYMDPRGLQNVAGQRVKFGTIRNSSEKVLIVDESNQTINDGHFDPGTYTISTGVFTVNQDRLSLRHDTTAKEATVVQTGVVAVPDGRGNVTFCDGHADFLSRAEVHSAAHAIPTVY
jgi:prepilin-type processing-associated H-X9-DG protein